MAKEAVQRLIERLAPFLDPEEPHGLTTSTQVLMSMRLLAGGCYQHLATDLIRVSQSSCSRSLNRFLDGLCSMRKLIVKFPENLDEVKQEFFDIAAFPGVIGAIDGTHISIKRPKNDPNSDIYFNRKRILTLNVQVVAGPDLRLYNVLARWAGSTHDSGVFSNSSLKRRIESGDLKGKGHLLGDKDSLSTIFTDPTQDHSRWSS